MVGKYLMGCVTLVESMGGYILCLTLSLLIFSLSSLAFADANQSDLFPQTLGPHLNGNESATQAIIDQLSKRLTAEPYRAELYYYLARAYASQGWRDKYSQYINQWIKLSNSGIVMKGPYAFVLDEQNEKVLAVDTNTKQVVRKIDVDWLPRKMVPTPDGCKLYVTNSLANSVSAINTEKIAVTKTIKTGNMPWNGKSNPQGDRVYVANLRSDDVSVIDTNNNALLENVKVGQGPWGVTISPDGHKLYVSNQNSRDIRIIDTGSYSIVGVVGVGIHPRDIALAPDDAKRLYAVDTNIVKDEVEIYVVDLEDSRVVDSMVVPASDDPLLTHLQQMSLEDKLELICSFARSGRGTQKYPTKPRMGITPKLTLDSQFSNPSARSVVASDEPLPMGGTEAIVEPEPAMDSYAKESPAQENSGDEGRVLRIIVVVKHDTLWQISMDNYSIATDGVFKAIQALNPQIRDVNRIYEGQKIKLPEMNASKSDEENNSKIVVVKPRDTLSKIALNNYGRISERIYTEILKVNPHIKDINMIKFGQKIALPEIPNTPFKDTLERVAQAHIE